MVDVYVRSIISGKMTIIQVPELWQSKVKEVFDKMLSDGEITQIQYDSYMGNID